MIKCYQIHVIHFLKTRIQRLHDGLIFVKKGIGVHVQHMLEMSRCLYTGGNFKQNVWKNRMEIWDLIKDYDLTNKRFVAILFLLKSIMRSLLTRLTVLHPKNVDKWKNGKLSTRGSMGPGSLT